jgi:5'-nucleotidase
MRILLSNDDSVHATGIKELFKELKKVGEVWVVAPLEEKSTTGHSLTIHKPIRVLKMEKQFYGVSGSPADCVNIGIREILKFNPDLVVSGINRGANLGQDVYYSGTVSAAREACIWGIPAIAVSLSVEFAKVLRGQKMQYGAAARVTANLIRQIMGRSKSKPIPLHTLLNINVPNLPFHKIKGIRLARQGFRHYSGSILKRTDHRGRDYFWIGGKYKGYRKDDGTDCFAVDQGFVSVTPMQLDVTDDKYMRSLTDLWPIYSNGKKAKL